VGRFESKAKLRALRTKPQTTLIRRKTPIRGRGASGTGKGISIFGNFRTIQNKENIAI
jgi:hypothetical protein